MIVRALRIDRDAAAVAFVRQRERVERGGIAHAERDHAAHLWPQSGGAFAMVRALLHPDHVAVAALFQPLAQALPRQRRGVGTCESACSVTEFRRLLTDKEFEWLALMHHPPLPR